MYLQKLITGRIKEIMKAKGITQHQLALQMGSDDAQVCRFLNPAGNMTLRTMERIEEVLGEAIIPHYIKPSTHEQSAENSR